MFCQRRRHRNRLLVLLFSLTIYIRLVRRNLGTNRTRLNTFRYQKHKRSVITRRGTHPSLLPRRPRLSKPNQINMLSRIKTSIVRGTPSVLHPRNRRRVFTTRLRHANGTTLLRRLRRLNRQLLGSLKRTNQNVRLRRNIPNSRHMLRRVVKRLLSLPNLTISLYRVFTLLNLNLMFIIARSLNVRRRNNRQNTRIIKRLHSRTLSLNNDLDLLNLLLTRNRARTVRANNRRNRLVISLSHSKIIGITTLRNLSLPTRRRSVTSSLPTTRRRGRQRGNGTSGRRSLTPLTMVNVRTIMVRRNNNLFIQGNRQMRQRPILNQGHFHRICPPLMSQDSRQVKKVRRPKTIMSSRRHTTIPREPIIRFISVPTKGATPISVTLRLLRLLFRDPLLNFQLIGVGPRNLIRRSLRSRRGRDAYRY